MKLFMHFKNTCWEAVITICDSSYAVAIENVDEDLVPIDFSARQISRLDNEQWFVFPCENWWLY